MRHPRTSQFIFWFLFYLSFLSFAEEHEYYYTISELKYNQNSKQIEISIKMAAHDIEYIFNKNNYCENPTIKCDELNILDTECIADYICSHFTLSIKNKPEIIEFIGQECENEGYIYFYFVVNDVSKKLKSYDLSNTIFFETYHHQKNITHFDYFTSSGEKKSDSFYFSANQQKQTFYIKH